MAERALELDFRERIDLDAEKGLLAALTMDPSSYFDVKGIITPEVFTHRDTVQAFNEIVAAYEENRPLPRLEDWNPVANHIDTARRLFELWQLRQISKLPGDLAGDLKKDDVTASGVLSKMQGEINRVQALIGQQRSDKAVSAATLFSEVMNSVEMQKGEGFGVKTHLPKLDEMLGGLQPALHLMAGAPGLGKTTLCIQIANHVSSDGIPVLFVTFDEVLWRLTLKSFCAKAGLTAKTYADGKFSDEEYADLKQAYDSHKEALANLHLIEGSSRMEVANLESLARQAMRRAGADTCLVVVDYLQRWASLKTTSQDFSFVVGRLVGELREMAFRLNAPVIVISSLDRKGYEDPTINDLKETGELEFSADTAMLLRENIRGTERMKRLDGTLLPRALRLNIAKNRYGQLGEVHLQFELSKGRITEKA
ncbi:AAA family ATPase [bacterium]|nr:AAA family ATPase [bacterium]